MYLLYNMRVSLKQMGGPRPVTIIFGTEVNSSTINVATHPHGIGFSQPAYLMTTVMMILLPLV